MIQKAKITIKSKLTIIKTTTITIHDGKGEFLAWLKNSNCAGASFVKW